MYQRVLLYAAWGFSILSAFLLFLLMRTEQRCIEYAAELVAARDEYLAYRILQRRMLDDLESSEEEEKKKLTIASDGMLFVNRDRDHLRHEALLLARNHDLEEPVRKLYDESPTAFRLPDRTVSRKRTRRAPRTALQASPQRRAAVTAPPRERIFSWPVDQGKFWISSPYGPRRRSGPEKKWEFHGGIDMAAMRGTPVYAAGPGVVEQAGWRRGYGNTILIRHDRGYKTRYAHLAAILVYSGDSVERTTMIGKVGDTGSVRSRGTDASHLHYEVYVHGKRVNPFHYTA